ITRPCQYFIQNGGFILSGGEKEDRTGVVDDRPGEGDAPGLTLRDVVGGDQAADFVNGLGVREDRGGVAVAADPQRHQIEARAFGTLQVEVVSQLRLVACRGFVRLQLALDAVNLLRAEGRV